MKTTESGITYSNFKILCSDEMGGGAMKPWALFYTSDDLASICSLKSSNETSCDQLGAAAPRPLKGEQSQEHE